ncbi:MAG: alpha-glucosidase, partial [Hahellaceae bacterium]|nr:alpha-glucosidase [Hahellaceae bacterium]
MRASNDGWRGAVIYQVYLRSFFDSDGDGVGDLPGLLVKLDYIASLGVDAIWISPFFTSPMQDFGYDISDYRSVDSLFGTLDDFDAVVRGCHAQNLGVIIDQVLNHTSDQHPWFQASAQDRDNPYADWYVWADPKPDGTPPNNWLSVFGGSAWQWNSRRRQYYLHNFLSCQPDLNYHHPAVRSQILSDVEFWLQRGVDGVRLDAINFCFHDRHLRDNPPAQTPERDGIGVRPDNPYAYQHHRFDKTQPENLAWLQDIRRLLDRYPGRMAMGEIGDDRPLATLAAYTQGAKRLHMAYSFDLLGAHPSKQALHTLLHAYQSGLNDGWPCWAMSNH